MKIKLPNYIIQAFADIKFSMTPMYISYKPKIHLVKGNQIRQLLNRIQPGDILLNRHNGYLSTFLTPGFWAHACIYIGDNTIIHAIGDGVCSEDILDFCRCDSICVLRPKVNTDSKLKATNVAIEMRSQQIQYDFDYASDNKTVYCTELVDVCYENIFKGDYVTKLGHIVLEPDNLFYSSSVDRIIIFKN